MRSAFRFLMMVLGGIIGGYIGYWLGHLVGWSTNADWPQRIGGGTGAVALSIAMAIVGVLLARVLLALPSILIDRRLRIKGDHAEASIVDRWSTGLTLGALHPSTRQYGILVEVRLPDGTHRRAHATQWLRPEEFAAMIPGRQVSVHYHLRHPDRVLVDTAHLAAVT